MKRATWTILILLLCTILTLTACRGPADPAEESSQLLSSEAVPQTETEMTSGTVHTSDIDLDSKPAENTAAVTASIEPVTTAAEPPEPDTTVPQSEPETPTSEPALPATPQPEPTKPTEPTPTQPAPTEPKPTEPAPTQPKPTEPAPTQPKPTEPAPTQPKPTEPTKPPTEPTQPPTEPPKPAIDASALEAYGNQYAANLGFQIDYSMTTGNSGYFPPDSAILYSEEEGRSFVAGQVKATYDYLIAYLGNIEGARCRVLVTSNGGCRYTVTVLYG